MTLLSICIPTYNRDEFLKKNLDLLFNQLLSNNLLRENIEIVVSNNFSNDKTKNLLDLLYLNFSTKIDFKVYHQPKPLPIPDQMIFVAEKSKGDFFMWLGDDDYLEEQYILEVINSINTIKELNCIVPSFIGVDLMGEIIEGVGRDLNFKNEIYNKGFSNILKNAWRGHQMSGLTIRRLNIIEEYKNRNIYNLYPFIFFVAYSSYKGKTLHLSEYPVKVTQPGQENKAWTYGQDGRLNEVFDNFKKLPINYFQKTLLQLNFYKKQPWRLFIYKKNGLKSFTVAFINIFISTNSTLLFKLIFPFIVLIQILKVIIKKII